ncbi:hypothetical protein HDU93_009553 [Gonapodya sp. JEL0774]|nr:hypothetical protein HDU93_009553 [Gonapodya sp. JEL0774]
MVIFEIAVIAVVLTVINYTSSQSSNADAIAQGTKSITVLANKQQRDASDKIKNQMGGRFAWLLDTVSVLELTARPFRDIATPQDAYLKKLYVLGNTTASAVYRGIVDPTDYDNLVPWMMDLTYGIGATLTSWYYWNNATLESVGIVVQTPATFDFAALNLTYDPKAPLLQLVYYATNKTCARYCPVSSTGTRQASYFINTTADRATTQASIGASTFKGWTRPWYYDRLPLGTPFISPVYTGSTRAGSPPRLLQSLGFSLWDKNKNYIGMGPINFGTFDLSSGLNDLKATATPNSFFYIMTPSAEVLAMTGVGTDQSPLLRLLPGTTTYALNTIWDFNATAYPLLNVSAATIYQYTGGNLSSDFADAQFSVGDFMFQVTSYTFANYKWTIVSGAPATDYIGDTLVLQGKLADRLWNVQKIVIIIGAL